METREQQIAKVLQNN